MGLEVVDEHPYQFDGAFWIYDFGLQRTRDRPMATDAATAGAEFEASSPRCGTGRPKTTASTRSFWTPG